MRKGLRLWAVMAILAVVGGCQVEQQKAKKDTWLLVSFEKDVPITYQMVSERQTQIDLTSSDPTKKSKPQIMTEKLELVLTYTPIEVDPFGLTTIKATCRKAAVTRSSFSGKKEEADAMEKLAGKEFTLKLSPTGEIADTNDLARVARELGEGAFVSGRENARIKNPDMINDFLAMQWFLWDATASVGDPLNMKPGKQWRTKQTVPWPVPFYTPPARFTDYTLDRIEDRQDGTRMAVITSTYEMSKEPMQNFVRPYEGDFQMRGMFGFLRNYQFESLTGGGTLLFNMDKGLIEKDSQDYTMHVKAAFMLPLGDSVPVLDVHQTIAIERIDTP
ncbi:MAG: hypothetical protein LLF76_11660 [Planctomycetaceae bacterium]|nr:hypothetical protein [Planctomycetaceae bacterium]